ncbi:MAG: DUF6379 domain-containing protein [Anaerolineales bacterium]|jgi:hypothetical protein
MPTKYLVLGYDDYVICDDSFRLTKWGEGLYSIKLDIRLNYYRGLHLSNITEFELKIDGEVIPESNIIFQLKGKEFAISQLPHLFAEFWGIKERATLEFFIGPMAEGEHDIELTMRLRSPYMRFAPGVYATIDSSARKTLPLRVFDLSSGPGVIRKESEVRA